jgi:hypothetical protein
MTVITESLSSMRIIPEVLWMYHSFSADKNNSNYCVLYVDC